MKKYRGFTLIELLAVITILAIILTITFSVISNVIVDSRTNSYDSQIETIENASKRYISDNIQTIDKTKDFFVTIKQLQNGGYLDAKKVIKNPMDNRSMTGCVVVSYSNTYNQYSYLYTDYGCLNEKLFTPKVTVSKTKDASGKYPVTITYPATADTIAGSKYVYILSTNNQKVTVTTTTVTGLSVASGTKITAQIEKGDYVIRKALEIA